MMDNICDDILAYIFSFLNLYSRLVTRLVCKQWKRISSCSPIYERIRYNEVIPFTNAPIAVEPKDVIKLYNRGLVSEDIRVYPDYHEPAIDVCSYITHMTKLHTLSLDIRNIRSPLPTTLTRLVLSPHNNIVRIDYLTNLREFELHAVVDVTGYLEQIVPICPTSHTLQDVHNMKYLQKLSLKGCDTIDVLHFTRLTSLSVYQIEPAMLTCLQLKELCIRLRVHGKFHMLTCLERLQCVSTHVTDIPNSLTYLAAHSLHLLQVTSLRSLACQQTNYIPNTVTRYTHLGTRRIHDISGLTSLVHVHTDSAEDNVRSLPLFLLSLHVNIGKYNGGLSCLSNLRSLSIRIRKNITISSELVMMTNLQYITLDTRGEKYEGINYPTPEFSDCYSATKYLHKLGM